jgi:hypothetical protein
VNSCVDAWQWTDQTCQIPWGTVDNLHGTPSLDNAHSSLVSNIIKFMLALLVKLFLHSPSLNFFQVESARSSSFPCHVASIAWAKGISAGNSCNGNTTCNDACTTIAMQWYPRMIISTTKALQQHPCKIACAANRMLLVQKWQQRTRDDTFLGIHNVDNQITAQQWQQCPHDTHKGNLL